MTKDEAMKLAKDACPYFDEISKGAFYEGFLMALDQLPDTTKMIDTGTDRGAWSDVPDATKWVDELRGDDVEEPPNSTTDVVESVYANKNTIRWLLSRGNPSAEVTAILRKSTSEECSLSLYTAPPKREWQGLTDDEVSDLKHWLDHRAQWSYIEFARAIEAKLKDKNRG